MIVRCRDELFNVPMGQRFRSFGINDLEMVELTGASWNQLVVWLRHLEGLRAGGVEKSENGLRA